VAVLFGTDDLGSDLLSRLMSYGAAVSPKHGSIVVTLSLAALHPTPPPSHPHTQPKNPPPPSHHLTTTPHTHPTPPPPPPPHHPPLALGMLRGFIRGITDIGIMRFMDIIEL